MKKYLLAAAMAVAVSGAFVSCHEDEISGSMIEQKAKAFETTFIEAFGQPAPNHTWGFKKNNIAESGVTRTEVDPKGNMWPEKPTVGTKEEIDVVAYVNRETSDDWTWYYPMPENLNNYFVTQIHKGTDEYHGVNQTQTFVGSNQMDKLMIADATDSSVDADGALTGSWFHVYDFNGGNSVDYGGNMLVIKSNTYDFSYHGSKDSKYHPRWIAIDGKDVPRTDGVADNYEGYYYICFDYESKPNDVYTVFEMPESNNAKAYVPGVWEAGTTGADLKEAGITFVPNGEYGVRQYIVQDGWKAGQVFNGDKWIPGNDIYTDWIIRLVKADVPDDPTPSGDKWKIVEAEEVVEAGRVFCEDLGASSLNDVDYNDVVFDAIIVHKYCKLITTTIVNGKEVSTETYEFTKDGKTGYSEYYAKVCLLAAGGTIPASVCGHEVHDVLSNSNLGTTVMINTTTNSDDVNGAQIATCSPVIIQETVGSETTDKIYINGNNKAITCIDDIDIDVRYGNAVTEITAPEGAVPYKICVPIGTPWAKERVNIGIAYKSFAEYCGINPDKEFWKDINKEGSPVWDDCASPFIITNNGVTRYIDEGDVLSYTESEYTGSGGNGGVSGGQIWASTDDAGTEVGYGNNVIVSYDKFTNASATSTIRLNFSYAGSNWQFFAKYGNSDNPFKQIGNYNNISTMSVTSGGYVDFEIGEALTGLQQNGLKIHGNELKISSIELR